MNVFISAHANRLIHTSSTQECKLTSHSDATQDMSTRVVVPTVVSVVLINYVCSIHFNVVFAVSQARTMCPRLL